MSDLERLALMLLHADKLPRPETEYRFHPIRRWRFDLAWPDRKLAVEIEGGTWIAGRHQRGKGFENDCDKYNAAAILGWTVLRYTGGMVKRGMMTSDLKELLNDCKT